MSLASVHTSSVASLASLRSGLLFSDRSIQRFHTGRQKPLQAFPSVDQSVVAVGGATLQDSGDYEPSYSLVKPKGRIHIIPKAKREVSSPIKRESTLGMDDQWTSSNTYRLPKVVHANQYGKTLILANKAFLN